MICHIANRGRGSMSITQGLLQLGLPFETSQTHSSLGKVVKESKPLDDFRKYGLILCANSDFAKQFDIQKVWDRVAFYEYRDSCQVDKRMLAFARRYFKRSVFCGPERKPIPEPVIPLNHCVMDEYVLDGEDCDRKFDIGCFFDKDNWRLGHRRKNMLETLEEAKLGNSLIGVSTSHAQKARLAITGNEDTKNFIQFLKMMKQCKIIFTAQPEKVDGDNRTWEALASGALVFADYSFIPTPNPLVNEEHFVLYDASDKRSILNAIEKAKWFLKHDQKRKEIAKKGYQHVMKYHRCCNRVQFILDHCERKKMFL